MNLEPLREAVDEWNREFGKDMGIGFGPLSKPDPEVIAVLGRCVERHDTSEFDHLMMKSLDELRDTRGVW